MESIRPAPTRHSAAGELVDDDNFPVLDDVIDIFFEQRVRTKRRGHVVHEPDVSGVIQTLVFANHGFGDQQLFDFLVTLLSQKGLL